MSRSRRLSPGGAVCDRLGQPAHRRLRAHRPDVLHVLLRHPHAAGQESSLLSYLDPIVSVLISVLLLGEPLAPIQIAGMVLFLGFAIANEFTHKNAETT